jgi:hypothetical protein
MVGNMRDLCEGEEDELADEEGPNTKAKGKARQVTTKEAEAYAKQEG